MLLKCIRKWIVLALTNILLSTKLLDALDSSTISLTQSELESFTNKKLGITIENLQLSSRRQLRNLVPPFQEFSNVDGIQYIDTRSRNKKRLPEIFGSFRFDTPDVQFSTPAPFSRRIDEYDDIVNTTLVQNGFEFADDYHRRKVILENAYKFIPINFSQTVESDLKDDDRNTTEKEQGGRFFKKKSGSVRTSYSGSLAAEPFRETLIARRSGIDLVENERNTSPKNDHSFIPKSYSELLLNYDETIAPFQRPFISEEDISKVNENDRMTVDNRYYRYIEPFKDEVTKFGDVNGPITALNRPFSEFKEDLVNFQKTQFDPIGYYDHSPEAQSQQTFFPPKVFMEYASDHMPQPNSKYHQITYPWKTRQPRVVFPPADLNEASTGASYIGSENVVFR